MAKRAAEKLRKNQAKRGLPDVDARLETAGLAPGSKGPCSPRPKANPAPADLPRRRATNLDAAPRGVLRVPAFDELPWLRAGFSTRENGLTTAYVAAPDGPPELNLGWTAQDPEPNVAANRQRLADWVRRDAPMDLVTMRQFHSGMIRIIEADHGPLTTPNGRAVLRGDALMTDVPGLLLGVQTADCVPVLIADPRNRAVAVFHAGWRGTLARIVERGVGLMRLRYGSKPTNLVAAIGPAIAACCFEIGDEVRQQFESQFAYASKLFYEVSDSDPVRQKYPLLFLTQRPPGHTSLGASLRLDLFEANRRQLLDAGLKKRNITLSGECTACTRLPSGARKYFSHRAEKGITGRMMSVMGVASGKW